MREHIRREAGQFAQSVWWLVPVAFAAVALAAVVVSETNPPARPLPPPMNASMSIVPAALPAAPAAPAATVKPQEEPQYEVEHVQAF
jgi:hypothetical protein